MNLINQSKFIKYLESLEIDTTDVMTEIKQNFNKEELEPFINSANEMLSPNTYIYDLTFKHVNIFLYQQHRESFVFEGEGKIDVKTIIATSNSLISRPEIEKPLNKSTGFSIPVDKNGFVVIARFERQIETRGYGNNNKSNRAIVCEGCLPRKIKFNPLSNFHCTQDIWTNEYCIETPFIQGFYFNENSIESQCVIWMNSKLLNFLGLSLDHYDNGLRALNENGDAVLIYRYWRENLIEKGASFVGTNSNISSLEGCDLILRNDFYKKLKSIIPDIIFYTQTI